tara:strand:+ start:7062 stop:7694 length:633 start_codon:yes stop_codon:yes gene_type:complete
MTNTAQSTSIYSSIWSRIEANGRGWVFTPADFLDLGSRNGIDMALFRLRKQNRIRRLAQGLYDYPEQSRLVGEVPPNPDAVAKALANEAGTKLLPSGAYAANQLGLTEQVPGKVVFLSDMNPRSVQIDKLEILIKRTTPKTMKMAGRTSGVVTQALRFLRKNQVTSEVVEILRERLSPAEKREILEDQRFAPAWIREIFVRVASEELAVA